jgi:hypothetical protein
MYIFEKEDRLGLSCIPNTYRPIEPTRNEQILIVKRAEIVYAGVFKFESGERYKVVLR